MTQRSFARPSGAAGVGRALTRGLVASAMIAGLAGLGHAQGGSTALTNPYAITFDDIQQAESSHWYSLTQFRFVSTLDPTHGTTQWIGLVEDLAISPATATQPARFDLSLRQGFGLSPEQEVRQARIHADRRGFLHQHGSFHVRDVAAADRNYSIHYITADFRLGRPIYRVSILPNNPALNVWILDLDVTTGYPLTRSEYTPAGQMLSMLTVVTFAADSAAQAQIGSHANWYSPNHQIDYPTPVDALAAMRGRGNIRLPLAPPDNFDPHRQLVDVDPITGDHTLVLEYTNGIEAIQLLQTPNVPSPIPVKEAGAYKILEFVDLQSKQLLFHVRDTNHLVIGSSSNPALEAFTDDVLRLALIK